MPQTSHVMCPLPLHRASLPVRRGDRVCPLSFWEGRTAKGWKCRRESSGPHSPVGKWPPVARGRWAPGYVWSSVHDAPYGAERATACAPGCRAACVGGGSQREEVGAPRCGCVGVTGVGGSLCGWRVRERRWGLPGVSVGGH